MTKNIMIVGVGGQGTLLASRILGNTVINEGYDVKVSEVHGMSQRGGSVVTYVKYGEKIYSPIVDCGEADIILAFEMLEAYRALPYLKKGGKMIVNTQSIDPMPVIGDYLYDLLFAIVSNVDILSYVSLENLYCLIDEPTEKIRAMLVVVLYCRISRCLKYHPQDIDIYMEFWDKLVKEFKI